VGRLLEDILTVLNDLTEDKREKEEIERMMELYTNIVKKCGGRREKEALSVLHERIRYCSPPGL
jgi:hypothetical protein